MNEYKLVTSFLFPIIHVTHFNIIVGDMGISGLSVSEGLTRESSKTKTSIIIIIK